LKFSSAISDWVFGLSVVDVDYVDFHKEFDKVPNKSLFDEGMGSYFGIGTNLEFLQLKKEEDNNPGL